MCIIVIFYFIFCLIFIFLSLDNKNIKFDKKIRMNKLGEIEILLYYRMGKFIRRSHIVFKTESSIVKNLIPAYK